MVGFHLKLSAQQVTTIAEPNSGINDALIMDQNGALYGSNFGSSNTGGSSVYKIDSEGIVTVFSTGYSSCNGLALDHEGTLYVVDFTAATATHQIYKLDSLGNSTPYGPTISGASGIIFDPGSDTLYVSQYNGTSSNQISKLSSDGIVTLHCDNNMLNGPVGMAFDDDSLLYVANFNDGKIFRITNNGDSLALIADIPNVSFWGVGFITFAAGYLYATGIGTHIIYKVSLDGMFTEYAGSGVAGSIDGFGNAAQFNRPNGITTNQNQDKLFISDYNTGAIREITGLINEIKTQEGNFYSSIKSFYNFPNPSFDLTTFYYSISEDCKLHLQLFNSSGVLLKTVGFQNHSNTLNNYKLNTKNLAAGIYYCKLTCKGYSKSLRFSIIH
jgi:sugar lactone lactonase YvrE